MAMGLTGKDKPYKEGFGPFPSFIHHTEYPYEYRNITDDVAINKLDTLLSKNLNPSHVAAIVVEIQLGEGGYIPSSPKFIQHLRSICDKNGILLIFDEVQTGFGRTGKMFGAEHVNVEPDMVTLAKGIGGGFPLAAVVGRKDIMDSIHDAGIGSTFGASPVSCAAALGVFEAFDNEDILSNAFLKEKIMKSSLNIALDNHDFIGDLRGYGPMIGVEIVEDKKSKKPNKLKTNEIINKCKENGLLLVSCGKEGNVIRFMGPLTTPENHIEEAMEIFKNSLN